MAQGGRVETGTAVGWRLALWSVVALLLGAAFLGTFRPMEPLAFPDYADSLAQARQRYAADSAAWRVTVAGLERVADSALRVSQTAKAEAERLRALRGVPVPVTYVPKMGTSDSTPMVSKADFDSLAAEADSLWSVVRADSVAYAAQAERIRADSSAYARLASLRAEENRIHSAENSTLRGALVKARRGCRVLGLLPCPTFSAGYGATLTDGAIRTGPVVAITVPVRF